jgi:hypothetical protein
MRNDADPESVLAALRAREPIFHREPPGTDRAGFALLVTEDYWEVGASGRRYDRAFVLDTVAARAPERPGAWRVDGFAVRPLGGGVWLATYVLHQGPRITRRATIWRRDGERWVAAYHQGTVVSGGDA